MTTSEPTAGTEPPVEPRPDPPRPKGSGGWQLVTPAVAGDYLTHVTKQRGIVPNQVAHYARQMRDDLWTGNPQPVVFDEQGSLIEGQHRCRAIVESGVPVWLYVYRGADAAVYESLDTGRPRGPRDLVSMQFPDVDAAALAGAAILLWKYEHDLMRSPNPVKHTPSEVVALIEHHEALLEVPTFSADIVRLFGRPAAAASFCYYLFSTIDVVAARQFFDAVEHGTTDRGTGARELRERLLANSGSRHKLRTVEKLALAIKAWNADRAGRGVTTLRWAGRGKSVEPFPKAE